ncbi:MAG: lysylphosphatidylglycerol synthase domain-containing protein, partial [Mycobacteriales bacterium]
MTRLARTVRVTASLTLAAGLVLLVLPRVTGADWSATLGRLRTLDAWQGVALVALWLLGLYAHTYVATAAMPRLTHRRALAMNLSGSAVSNIVPFGGALGMGLNYRMVRSWGLAGADFAPFTTVTTGVAVLIKLVLPVLALSLLVLTGGPATGALRACAVIGGVVLIAVVGGFAALLSSRRAAAALGHGAQVVVDRLGRFLPAARGRDASGAVQGLRERIQTVVTTGWRRMLLGALAYAALQAALLWVVLTMLGSQLGPVAVFAGFAVGRVLTLLVFTPGGLGSSEAGSAAVLIALGGDPVIVASGIVLFSVLTFALEIPVGG